METVIFLIKKLARDRTAMFGAIIIFCLIFIAIFAPYLSTHPEDITEFHPSERLSAPSFEHFFGTDRMGLMYILDYCLVQELQFLLQL